MIITTIAGFHSPHSLRHGQLIDVSAASRDASPDKYHSEDSSMIEEAIHGQTEAAGMTLHCKAGLGEDACHGRDFIFVLLIQSMQQKIQ